MRHLRRGGRCAPGPQRSERSGRLRLPRWPTLPRCAPRSVSCDGGHRVRAETRIHGDRAPDATSCLAAARRSTSRSRRSTSAVRDGALPGETKADPWQSLATPSMGFVASRRSRRSDRCDGLPHRHLPLSEFLAPSAACSHCHLVVIFHTTSAHRLSDLQSFSRTVSRVVSRRPLLSCRLMSHMPFGQRTSRLQSFPPTGRPSLASTLCTSTRAAALLVFPLFEVLWKSLRRAEALPSHAFRRRAREGLAAGISGYRAQRPGHGSGESRRPP